MTHDTKAPTLVEALKRAHRVMDLGRRFIESDQVHDKDLHGHLSRGRDEVAAALSAHEAAEGAGEASAMAVLPNIDRYWEWLHKAESDGFVNVRVPVSVWREVLQKIASQQEALATPSRARQAEGRPYLTSDEIYDLRIAVDQCEADAVDGDDEGHVERLRALVDRLATPAPPPVTLDAVEVAARVTVFLDEATRFASGIRLNRVELSYADLRLMCDALARSARGEG